MNATVEDVTRASEQVVKAQLQIRQTRSVDSIIESISKAAALWLPSNSPWRIRALSEAPLPTGFSPEMIAEAIDLTFSAITKEAMQNMLDRELGDRHVLDGFCPRVKGRTTAVGPLMISHFLAGNVPSPAIISICCGLLLKSGNIVKTSSRDPVFPRLFVESLRTVDSELADAVFVLSWRRNDSAITEAALTDAVIAYGDDDSVNSLRAMKGTNPGTRFLGYGHKLSFGLITQDALNPNTIKELADAAAFDVSVYDQQGCMSPQVFYVEKGGVISPLEFAKELSYAMARYEQRVPRGELSIEEAATIASLRSDYEFRAASDTRIACWTQSPCNEWVVIYDEDWEMSPSCLNRVIYISPVENLEQEFHFVNTFQTKISTIGLASMSERVLEIIQKFPWTETPRVCKIGQMQRPSLTTFHDGRPRIADLVRWIDID